MIFFACEESKPKLIMNSILFRLKVRKDITAFLNITDVDNEGDIESFYTHGLSKYIRPIAEKILSDYRCGVGVFIMQVYEHHNKQTKGFMKNRTNSYGIHFSNLVSIG